MSIQIDPSAFSNGQQQQGNVSQPATNTPPGRKYSTLHVYAGILQIIGWIAVGIGFIIAIIGFSSGYDISMKLAGMMSGVGMMLAGFVLVAMGQLICVWRDTEENTRKIAELLESKK